VGKLNPKQSIRDARRNIHLQHLLEAAERVFAARGYTGTRMQEVASEAGLALATVYELVDSKEDLYAEIHRLRGRALLEQAGKSAVGATGALDALLRGVAAYGSFLMEHSDYLKILLRESQPWALNPEFPSKEQGRQWREGLELTVAMFDAAIAERSLVAQKRETPQLLARLMIAAHQVYLGSWVDGGMSEPPAELIGRMQEHVTRVFGIRRKRNLHAAIRS
jgi:AcrR family transcriptional regulator